MDEFQFDRPGLDGTLVSMEFGPNGRIDQLWTIDPLMPSDAEEFQFILAPLPFGGEVSIDYNPGTILLGARTSPSDPWVVSRNTNAEVIDQDEPGVVAFEYEFSLLPELAVTGKFFEKPGIVPQVIWEVTLTNQSRKAIEIGEMGFPMALNNITEVPTRGGPTVETSSLVVQKAIAGAASYLYAHPINGEEPGLLVIPGENTEWEFYNSVPSSLNSSYAWAGIPIVYVCSKATIEREGWPEWANGHSSITMERNESRTIQIAFASVGRRGRSELIETLAMCGAPSIQVFPSAVVPADVGAAVEISGVVPMTFTTLGPAQLESDSDEDGGFCFVRPDEPTPLRLDLTDQSGRSSYVHLKFVQPIETLIKRRAAWIAANQTWPKAIGSWKHSILSENPFWPRDEIESENSFSISGGLADALFLAEKNTLYPVAKEIAVLNRYVEEFLLKNIQNPADMSIGGSLVDERSVAIHYGRPRNYILAMSFYNSLSKVAVQSATTKRTPEAYCALAVRTAMAFFRRGIPQESKSRPIAGASVVGDVLARAKELGVGGAESLQNLVLERARALARGKRSHYLNPSMGSDELYFMGQTLGHEGMIQEAISLALDSRSLSPSWFWYGGEARTWDKADEQPQNFELDSGELALNFLGPLNGGMLLDSLAGEYDQFPDLELRAAFGGLMSVWATVAPDGSASMSFCPDYASEQRNLVPSTGDSGLGLFHYLRSTAAYVLPGKGLNVMALGCHFEAKPDRYKVKPWDGVGRKIILRQIHAAFEIEFGQIEELELDIRKRWARLTIHNPKKEPITVEVVAKGLWGEHVEVQGQAYAMELDAIRANVDLIGKGKTIVEFKVL